MILTGAGIAEAVQAGEIEVDPYNPVHINPASMDLTLGPLVRVYSDVAERLPYWPFGNERQMREKLLLNTEVSGAKDFAEPMMLDTADENASVLLKMSSTGFILEPGTLYLMATAERVLTRKYVPIVDGKSSIGRFGVFVHITAGFGDPGFDGQYTLEVASIMHRVVIYPGMRFCQIRFHAMQGRTVDYADRGNYIGEASMGPVASKSWKQFVAPCPNHPKVLLKLREACAICENST